VTIRQKGRTTQPQAIRQPHPTCDHYNNTRQQDNIRRDHPPTHTDINHTDPPYLRGTINTISSGLAGEGSTSSAEKKPPLQHPIHQPHYLLTP